jgi:hypothetical protein
MVALFLLPGLRPPVRLPLAICFVYLVYFPSILGACGGTGCPANQNTVPFLPRRP